MFTIVNKGLSLIIVNKTTNFIKTVVFGKKLHAILLNVILNEVKKLKLLDIFLKTTQ